MKFERIMNIFFYILTFLLVLFAFQSIFGFIEDNRITFRHFLGILLGCFYMFAYYCHTEIIKHDLEENYVEKETYASLLSNFLKIREENKKLKEGK